MVDGVNVRSTQFSKIGLSAVSEPTKQSACKRSPRPNIVSQRALVRIQRFAREGRFIGQLREEWVLVRDTGYFTMPVVTVLTCLATREEQLRG